MPKVLLIDDDAALTGMLTEFLRGEGFETAAAFNGTEGAAAALDPSLDAVILDVMMPGLDGFEVLRKLRSGADAQCQREQGDDRAHRQVQQRCDPRGQHARDGLARLRRSRPGAADQRRVRTQAAHGRRLQLWHRLRVQRAGQVQRVGPVRENWDRQKDPQEAQQYSGNIREAASSLDGCVQR